MALDLAPAPGATADVWRADFLQLEIEEEIAEAIEVCSVVL